MRLYKSIEQLIGKTPLLEFTRLEKELGLEAKLIGKIEAFNPTGSSKDRAALSMIEAAERDGLLKPDSVIIEPTSGNTGIGIAAVGAAKGYRVIIVMPETMSIERRQFIKAYGGEIVLTDGAKGMQGAIERAAEIAKSYNNSFIPQQFENHENSKIHYYTTGPEIYEDLEGQLDIFVAGVGTGGTITGAGAYLKEKNPKIRVVAVEPKTSAVLSGGTPGAHRLQGIGAGFVPSILNTDIYDEIITVTDEAAYEAVHSLAAKEGILAGISSGAALYAAIELAKRAENKGKNIVVLLPDHGNRYLSSLSE